jgi:hypothetical protein
MDHQRARTLPLHIGFRIKAYPLSNRVIEILSEVERWALNVERWAFSA